MLRAESWTTGGRRGYFVISSPPVRSPVDENHEVSGTGRGGARRGIVPTINERLARVHDAHKSSRLFVSLVRVTWRISFAPLHVLRNTYAASCYIASRTFDNLIGRDFTWIRVRVLVIS